jgi:hypothetical protein
MRMPVDRETFFLFPSAGRGRVALEVRANFLPGFKT